MNKKISLGITISLMAIVATLAIALTYTFAINVFEARMSAITDRQTTSDLLTEIDNKIRQKYDGELDEQSIREGVAAGYIDSLDDASCAYFTAEEWELESDKLAGYGFGFGMSLGATSGGILVRRVDSGSPANGKLLPGDVITSIDGVAVGSIGYTAATQKLADATAEVELTISRNGSSTSYKLTKSRYTIISVEAHTVGDFGCIAIFSFNAKTPEQFNSALTKLQQSSVKGLIIDLRGCTGGSFDIACSILDTLLPAGRLLLVESSGEEPATIYTSDARCTSLPIRVLVCEDTYCAGEFFAAAIADYESLSAGEEAGSSIIGTATAGCFDYTEDFALSDGSALRLATGRWSTPAGRVTAGGVVQPGFEVNLTSYQKDNLWQLTDEEDPHIQTALSLLGSLTDDESEKAVSHSDTAAKAGGDE